MGIPDLSIEGVLSIPLTSNHSLLDGDIVLFVPDFPSNIQIRKDEDGNILFIGREEYSKFDSALEHWKQEIEQFCSAGKNLFFFLRKKQKIILRYVEFDHYKYDSVSNYDALPNLEKMIENTSGCEMGLTGKCKFLSDYWNEFSSVSQYEVYFNKDPKYPLIKTRNGKRYVGALLPFLEGRLILLPPVDFSNEEFDQKRFILSLIDMDKKLRKESEISSPPAWVQVENYKIQKEEELKKQILQISNNIDSLSGEREKLQNDVNRLNMFKALLYEKGPLLEEAILESLKLLDFKVETLDEGDVDFDVKFSYSDEGEFLGEIEGKDAEAIDLHKFDQLLRNIADDLKNNNNGDPAIGVLFGNAERLMKLEDRGGFFTDKCKSFASKFNFILIRTPDLYPVIQYLLKNPDPQFKKDCRNAIIIARGAEVQFPPIPQS